MEDSGAILSHISSLKDMLDRVNEEIEANYHTTREIEAEIEKCCEIECALAGRESELMKTVFMLNFEINGLMAVTANTRDSCQRFQQEISSLKVKRDETSKRMNNKLEVFSTSCLNFQKDIEKDNAELEPLLLEKEHLENEIQVSQKKISSLQNSLSAFLEEVLDDLHNSNSALLVEIRSSNLENDKLVKDITELKSTLLSVMTT